MAAYLTLADALDRLNSLGVDPDAAGTVTNADLRAASEYLDSLAPFKGARPEDQELQFPRVDAPLDENEEPIIPENILDFVALMAVYISADEEPPIKRESAGRTSVEYAYPKTTANQKRLSLLLRPYLRRTGTMG